ncbi:MAG: glucokinase [Parvibaculum sp.]|nr:glucokinase [Parvibaculum sp.]
MGEQILVADIGGTHARFALAEVTGVTLRIGAPSVLLTAHHQSLDAALATYLNENGNPVLNAVAICAAGPVTGASDSAAIAMTNCPWDVSVASLARATGVAHPVLMNDFAALALAVPHLTSHDLFDFGGAAADPAAAIAIVGPGTGLGVGALMPTGDGAYVAIPGEGGHVDITATTPRELAVVEQLMKAYGRVSIERVLSGPGLVSLYMALNALAGQRVDTPPSAFDIATRARDGKSPLASEAVSLFCGWLGATAGNLALTLGARGGIYIGGGIVPGWLAADKVSETQLFDTSLFQHHFLNKGRLRNWLAQIPIRVITRPDPALLGLAHAAMESRS